MRSDLYNYTTVSSRWSSCWLQVSFIGDIIRFPLRSSNQLESKLPTSKYRKHSAAQPHSWRASELQTIKTAAEANHPCHLIRAIQEATKSSCYSLAKHLLCTMRIPLNAYERFAFPVLLTWLRSWMVTFFASSYDVMLMSCCEIRSAVCTVCFILKIERILFAPPPTPNPVLFIRPWVWHGFRQTQNRCVFLAERSREPLVGRFWNWNFHGIAIINVCPWSARGASVPGGIKLQDQISTTLVFVHVEFKNMKHTESSSKLTN